MEASQQAATIQPKPAPLSIQQRPPFDEAVSYQSRPSLDTNYSMPSPVYTDFQESPMFRNTSPFSPWSGTDDFLGPAHALDLTAHYMRQQQLQNMTIPRSSPLNRSFDPSSLKAMQMADGMNFTDGTIRPNMLDCSVGYDLDQMDSVMFNGDYECQMGMAA